MRHVLIDGVKIMYDLCLFIFWADWQASAVDSLKTHNSNVYDELTLYTAARAPAYPGYPVAQPFALTSS